MIFYTIVKKIIIADVSVLKNTIELSESKYFSRDICITVSIYKYTVNPVQLSQLPIFHV